MSMNLADLTTLLHIVVGPLCGIYVALIEKDGFTAYLLLGLIGLIIGCCIGYANYKFAYSLLASEKSDTSIGMAIYGIFPLILLLCNMAGTTYLSLFLTKHFFKAKRKAD